MNNKGFASLFCRWILALLLGMVGYYKVFELTVTVHAKKFFVDGFADFWLPDWLLWGLGFSIPFIEFSIGILLFCGLWVRYAAIVVGFLLVIVAYGHILQDAFYDPMSHLMPRLILVIAVLLLYSFDDKWTLDNWIEQRKAGI